MNLVIDSNILFTFFWEKSTGREIIKSKIFNLISPEFALEEINRYKSDIIKRTKVSIVEFNKLREELTTIVEFIPLDEYDKYLHEAFDICPDKNDVDFFALALSKLCPIWSNDSDMKKQDEISILNTLEIIEFIDI